MSVHVPSLPSSAAWETPLNVSRDVLGAISDAADSAAESAGQLIHRRRSGSQVRSVVTSRWTAVTVAVLLALVVASVVRRSRPDAREGRDVHHDRAGGAAPDGARA